MSHGRLPLSVVWRLARLLRRKASPPSGVLDQLFAQLLADFSAERREAVDRFFADVRSDQGLLGQITPAGMEVFNASTQDRPGVRYGCVVSRARPPRLRSLVKAGLDPYAQATHALFAGLYRVASGSPRRWLPPMTAAQAAVLRRAYPVVHPVEDVLSAALMNGGPIIHPPLILMNAGALEHFERWDIHNEGTHRPSLQPFPEHFFDKS